MDKNGSHGTPLREASLRWAKLAADKQFAGRKGHGGNPELAERHLSKQELQVLLAAAFEAGAELTVARSESERIPAGWKLVPIEPTDEMVIAGVMEGVGDSFRVHDERQMQRMWADMLQAAPEAPK